MEKTLRMSLLFDFYGALLTERQRDAFQRYFHEDLSLGEIAGQLDVSRQAVFDLLQRAEGIMEDFESKLGLLENHRKRQKFFEDLLALAAGVRSANQDSLDGLQRLEEKIRQAQAAG